MMRKPATATHGTLVLQKDQSIALTLLHLHTAANSTADSFGRSWLITPKQRSICLRPSAIRSFQTRRDVLDAAPIPSM